MSSFGVVLDACTLIPAALRDTLLRAAEAELYRPYWSEAILQEVQQNLVENQMTSEGGAQRLVNTLRISFDEAAVTSFEHLVESMTNDPKDRHVAAAAVASGAQVIVTANLQDFPEHSLAPYDIEAQSPDTFLSHLFDLAPDRMVQIIVDQAADCDDPPMTPDRVLDNLVLHAPSFVEQVRWRLAQQAALRAEHDSLH